MSPPSIDTSLPAVASGYPQFVERKSRDARALLLAAAAVSVALVMARSLWTPWLTALILLIALLWRAKNEEKGATKTLLRRLLPVNAFMIFLWVSLPFTVAGESVHWLGLDWSRVGLHLAALSTGKANAIALVFMLLLTPLGIHGVARALMRLKLSPKLTWLFLLTVGTIHRLRDHFATALRAMKLRLSPDATLRQRWDGYAAVLARAFVQSALRAETLQKAMRCRGIDPASGALPSFDTKRWDNADSAMLFVALALAIALAVFG
ncbi:MAG: energy-coupling factor transporter transmembrane protein EcfT [Burkholderiales bacterium]|jgi:cobalt/nickel transport system permease protein|nr:energy-coupling factor transporter transmembrane protein EcfT [Burkholderiales bacterium]